MLICRHIYIYMSMYVYKKYFYKKVGLSNCKVLSGISESGREAPEKMLILGTFNILYFIHVSFLGLTNMCIHVFFSVLFEALRIPTHTICKYEGLLYTRPRLYYPACPGRVSVADSRCFSVGAAFWLRLPVRRHRCRSAGRVNPQRCGSLAS